MNVELLFYVLDAYVVGQGGGFPERVDSVVGV
jgi:hypothetical protein